MKKSKWTVKKYKVGDEVLWKDPPIEYKVGGGRYIHGVGVVTEKSKMGYTVIFHGKDRRSSFYDQELEPATKLHKVLK